MPEDPCERLEQATAELDPPFAVLDMDALWANAADMEVRAAPKPIRLASKSVRCRALQERVLEREGFGGTLAFTLPEALWLAGRGFEDILVAYPTVDRRALRALATLTAERPETRIAIMVDNVAQLDLLDSATGVREGMDQTPVRVCLELDAGLWMLGGRVRIGAKRSPIHTPAQAAVLARAIVERPGVRLAGVMAYEAQIAGLGDEIGPHPPGRGIGPRLRAAAIRLLQRASARELATRRGEAVAAVSALAPLEFVNGGGTGSLESTAREAAVTEIAAVQGSMGQRCSTPTAPLRRGPRRCSRCRSCADLRLVSQPRLAVATSPLGPQTARVCPVPTCPQACASIARRGPARCRPRCSVHPPARLRWAIASGCATPRPASSASDSTVSTSLRAAGSSRRRRLTVARDNAFCESHWRYARGNPARGGGDACPDRPDPLLARRA